MTPYYQDELITIYHGDALEILPALSGFDFTFADPPFNVGINYGKDKDRCPTCAGEVTPYYHALASRITMYNQRQSHLP